MLKKTGIIVVVGFVILSVLSFLTGSGNQPPKDTPVDTNQAQISKEPENPAFTIEESERDELATQYCQKRANDTRVYPIPVKNSEGSDKEYDITNDSREKGSNLTHSDCLTIIDYLVWMKNESFPVFDINIDNIINRQYWIDMNTVELMSSIGWPNDINTSNYGGLKQEQWVYYKDSQRINALNVYVENSKVTSYQDY